MKCPNPDSCLGMIEPLNIAIGECAHGFKGILCQDCEIGFSKSSFSVCSGCPKPVLNALRLIFMLFLFVAILLLLIRSTLNGASDKHNVTSIFIKILMNHS